MADSDVDITDQLLDERKKYAKDRKRVKRIDEQLRALNPDAEQEEEAAK